jgi:methyl-accepting chemotaxis protein
VARAEAVSRHFERALQGGELTEDDLFDFHHPPIPGTDPQQFEARFADFIDRTLQDYFEEGLTIAPGVAYCVAVTRDGFLPTHNLAYSKPQGPDAVWNNKHCRNRRFFNNPVELAAARSTAPFLVQAYRRNMGGGVFTPMIDASSPIVVNGRHWGAMRLGYAGRAQAGTEATRATGDGEALDPQGGAGRSPRRRLLGRIPLLGARG